MAVLHNSIIGPCFAGGSRKGEVPPSRRLTEEEGKAGLWEEVNREELMCLNGVI